ncbi:MAG: hypothetical protein ACE5HX_07675 [bacterium]
MKTASEVRMTVNQQLHESTRHHLNVGNGLWSGHDLLEAFARVAKGRRYTRCRNFLQNGFWQTL